MISSDFHTQRRQRILSQRQPLQINWTAALSILGACIVASAVWYASIRLIYLFVKGN